jgi:hypothetical protein
MHAPITGTLTAALLAVAGCAPVTQIQTVAAPEAGLNQLRTFHVVPAHPDNSPVSHALGSEITTDLRDRGYSASTSNPDVLVEYATAAPELLDPTDWAYGYLWRPARWRDWGPNPNDATQAEYENGALVIDVIDAHTKQLLWRGHGVADVTGDEHTYVRKLDQAVTAILDQFPEEHLVRRTPSSSRA